MDTAFHPHDDLIRWVPFCPISQRRTVEAQWDLLTRWRSQSSRDHAVNHTLPYSSPPHPKFSVVSGPRGQTLWGSRQPSRLRSEAQWCGNTDLPRLAWPHHLGILSPCILARRVSTAYDICRERRHIPLPFIMVCCYNCSFMMSYCCSSPTVPDLQSKLYRT